MPLSNGTRLGTYVIEAPLGAGGMGEVYLARDTKLGRSVAVKVLLEAFLSDPDRIARFEREAKMLAALNHPHIAALLSMEQAGGQHFLVMELVGGETLAERLRRGPIPVSEALRVAHQIADALEAAHEKGVVHRDLKPANIKITVDDAVKVLDFGLAKALESPAAASNVVNSPTLSMMATQAGIILGTAAYMSPEQAKGLPVDHRSDIFSFGTVLYEMLTGRLPFPGETAPDILASVLVREPELQALALAVGPRVVDLVRRCLEKNPKRRWQAAGDLRAEIETILTAAPGAIAARPAADQRQPLWKRAWPVALAAIAASALTLMVGRSLTPARAPAAVTRFVIPPSEGQLYSSVGGQVLAIAPDGSQAVYVANGTLFIRTMSSLEPRQIQGVELGRGASMPVFSPDGRSVLFWSPDGYLKRIAVVGGAPIIVCPAGVTYGIGWTADGITFGQPAGIMRIAADGATPELIVKTSGDDIAYGPQLLPGGKAVLFTLSAGVSTERWDRAIIMVQSLENGERKRLIEGGADARYLPTGHIVYALGGTLYGVRFDAKRLEVRGTAVPVLEGVQRAFAGATGTAQFSVSETGSLAYIPGPIGGSTTLFDIGLTDRKGAIEPLHLPPGQYAFPRVSPSGTHLAFQTEDAREAAIWVQDLRTRSAQRRLTLSGANRYPVWSPDSQRIAFQSNREGDLAIFALRADGTGPVERLTKPDQGTAHIPESWSPDGAHLLFAVQSGARVSLWVLSLRDRKSAPFTDVVSTSLTTAMFSPDGKWVAYATARAAANDTVVNVQPFPATGAVYQVFAKSGDNPHHPLWSADGKELFYVPRVGGFEVVTVSTTPTVSFGNAVPVARAFPTAAPTTPRTFDLAGDGRIISAISGTGGVPGRNMQPIHVVLNWFEELNARIPK